MENGLPSQFPPGFDIGQFLKRHPCNVGDVGRNEGRTQGETKEINPAEKAINMEISLA